MSESPWTANTPYRGRQIVTSVRGWLTGERGRPEPLAPHVRRQLNLELLESRIPISDALLSLMWPGSSLIAETDRPALPYTGAAPADPDRAGVGQTVPGHAHESAQSTPTTAVSLDLFLPITLGPVTPSWGHRQFLEMDRGGVADPFPSRAIASPLIQGVSPVVANSLPREAAEAAPVAGTPSSPARFMPDHPEIALTSPAPDLWPLANVWIAGHSASDGPAVSQQDSFGMSWQAGSRDDAGRFMGGTELMQLETHRGQLFAGTSVLSDVPGKDPVVGAQILRLDSPGGPWRVDYDFGNERGPLGVMRYMRVEDLESVTFTTDGEGNPLPQPVSMLLATPSDLSGRTAVYSRNDTTRAWSEMVLAQGVSLRLIRSLWLHRDTVTQVDRVFAGVSGLGTFSGVYDPNVLGRIRWTMPQEYSHRRRTTGFAEVAGVLHTTPTHELFVRVDGAQPSWQWVYSSDSLIRGLTAVPRPGGVGQVLLASTEDLWNNTVILRFDPLRGYEPTTELDVTAFLRARWGGLTRDFVLAGYNEMTNIVDPSTGEPITLIGLLAFPPPSVAQLSSWYLVRHADARYELREIGAQAHATLPGPRLKATRSIVVSPFAADAGRALYFAGYDVELGSAHNSAWIYRASLEEVFQRPSAPIAPGPQGARGDRTYSPLSARVG